MFPKLIRRRLFPISPTQCPVSPFALANVADLSTVHLIVDSALLAVPADHHIAFHPSTADRTSFVSVTDLRAFITHYKKDFVEVDFKALATEAGAPATAKAEGSKKEVAKKEEGKETWKKRLGWDSVEGCDTMTVGVMRGREFKDFFFFFLS